jgi:hypothetical protein
MDYDLLMHFQVREIKPLKLPLDWKKLMLHGIHGALPKFMPLWVIRIKQFTGSKKLISNVMISLPGLIVM